MIKQYVRSLITEVYHIEHVIAINDVLATLVKKFPENFDYAFGEKESISNEDLGAVIRISDMNVRNEFWQKYFHDVKYEFNVRNGWIILHHFGVQDELTDVPYGLEIINVKAYSKLAQQRLQPYDIYIYTDLMHHNLYLDYYIDVATLKRIINIASTINEFMVLLKKTIKNIGD